MNACISQTCCLGIRVLVIQELILWIHPVYYNSVRDCWRPFFQLLCCVPCLCCKLEFLFCLTLILHAAWCIAYAVLFLCKIWYNFLIVFRKNCWKELELTIILNVIRNCTAITVIMFFMKRAELLNNTRMACFCVCFLFY